MELPFNDLEEMRILHGNIDKYSLNLNLFFISRQAITATAIKHTWAAIIIQKYSRGFLVRRIYQLIIVAAVTIQAYSRGYLARKRYRKVSL